MSLTTPVIKDSDAVFPGENWFFYWKTSASLWTSKLSDFQGSSKIIIPINWSFHSETGESCDFAVHRPETDLKRLCESVKEAGKEPAFFLPLGPVPYLPNGGLPHLLARSLSINSAGLPFGMIDQEDQLHKIYSFFDSRVFKAFGQFVEELGQYFSLSGIDSDIWGIECGHVSEDGFRSYFEDKGRVYDQAFSRYLDAQKEESSSEGPDISEERVHHIEFERMIKDLYLQSARDSLAGNWEGIFKVAFLGGDPHSLGVRLYDNDSLVSHADDLLEAIGLDTIPSSILLGNKARSTCLPRMMSELVVSSVLESWLGRGRFEEADSRRFRPLQHFEVYDLRAEEDPDFAGWADLGLWEFLQRDHAWCFSDKGESPYTFDESLQSIGKVYFFHGLGMSKKLFHEVLKTFMSGGQVVLNRSGLSTEYLRRLESFLMENSLKVEKIKFHCSIHYTTLGEGKLIIFEGDELQDLSHSQSQFFWKKLVNSFSIGRIELPYSKELKMAWKTRAPGHQELSYEEIRRLCLYNPSSYKQRIKFSIPSNFKILKVVDEHQVKMKNTEQSVELDFLPGGSVNLDFGVFDES